MPGVLTLHHKPSRSRPVLVTLRAQHAFRLLLLSCHVRLTPSRGGRFALRATMRSYILTSEPKAGLYREHLVPASWDFHPNPFAELPRPDAF